MKNKRIMLAFLMLLVTAVALTTASYAWFTANTRVQLGNIDVNVQASNGIQVSTDATNWKASLTTTELKGTAFVGNTNQFPNTLSPVSTVGSLTTGKFNMFVGELNEDATLDATAAPAEVSGTNGQYIAFDLFFKAATAQDIYLNDGSGIDAALVVGTVLKDTGLKYSARVGFLVQGTDATNTPATAQALATGTSTNQYIWEPNADDHTATAIGLGASGIVPYSGLRAVGNNLNLTTLPPTNFATVLSNTSTVGTVPSNKLFTVGPGITKVRVYIWIDGQDIDCENSASLGSGIRTVLDFIVK